MAQTGQTRHPAVEAALRTASALTGMEVVFVGRIDDTTFVFDEILGELPGLACGQTFEMNDTFCARMLAGAPRCTADAAGHPAYADVPARDVLGIKSYVGVPIHDGRGRLVGTLCGVDRGQVEVDEAVLGVMEELANIVGRYLSADHDDGTAAQVESTTTLRRVGGRWVVENVDASIASAAECQAETLVEAMVLADLLVRDLTLPPRPAKPRQDLGELEQLQLTVTQLQHALTARILIEQAIGVLAERLRLPPRGAFERLRYSARTRQRRVHDLAREVVESATDTGVSLPPDLRNTR